MAASDFLKQLQNSGEQLLLYWLFFQLQIIMNNKVIKSSTEIYKFAKDSSAKDWFMSQRKFNQEDLAT